MPSAFAHCLVGASLSHLLPRRARSPRLAAGLALLAASPDLDVVGYALGVPYEHPLGHRGLSHSLVFAAAAALAALPLWRRLDPGRARVGAVLAFLALASHGVLDAFTDAGLGIGLFIPLDGGRYFAPWRPLRTSPLSIREFFSHEGLEILANEAFWIGIPTLLFLGSARAVRHRLDAARRRAR